MNKYFLFMFDDYYPCGGFADCEGVFDSEEDALKCLSEKNWHSVDNVELCTVRDNEVVYVYTSFTVLDFDGIRHSVFGSDGKKVIRLLGKRYGPPLRYQTLFEPMKEYRLELFDS